MDDDPLSALKARLHNWARWSSHDVMPNLAAKLSSLWSQWLPRQAWDAGWGDMGAPEELNKSIDDKDAQLIDKHIREIGFVHRTIIKRHYLEHVGQGRDSLDAACRALLDVMQ